MENEQKKQLILDFINGPLKEYFEGQISFGRFKERINETLGTNFSYSDLYPSYLFNAQLTYEEEYRNFKDDMEKAYGEKLSKCHAYGLCASGDTYMFPCKTCPGKKQECHELIPGTFIACGEGVGEEKQYCSDYCYNKTKEKIND